MAVRISAIFDDYDTAEFTAKYIKEQNIELMSRKIMSLYDTNLYDDGELAGAEGFSNGVNLIGGPISFSVEMNRAFGFPGLTNTIDRRREDSMRSDVVLEITVASHNAQLAENIIVSHHGRMVRVR